MVLNTANKAEEKVTGSAAASHWTLDHLRTLGRWNAQSAPVIAAENVSPVIAGKFVWDMWPVQALDGSVPQIAGGQLWVLLSAPRTDNPDDRHNVARLRLMLRKAEGWVDCGDLLPDNFSPGSREWSGSTQIDLTSGEVTLWFTASGHRGEDVTSFEQRIFRATGTLDLSGPTPRMRDWHSLVQTPINDGTSYADLKFDPGVAGRINGYRDPFWFRDPADGLDYVLFTGTRPTELGGGGVVGIAMQSPGAAGGYGLLPPLIVAGPIAHELECVHCIVRNGLYYIFWSTQSRMFSPDVPVVPTGLFGMAAASLFGPYTPLNETGLVIANPVEEPRQAYAWRVTPTLEVASFVDYWGLNGRSPETDPALKAAQFGGTVAPMLRIELDGYSTRLI